MTKRRVYAGYAGYENLNAQGKSINPYAPTESQQCIAFVKWWRMACNGYGLVENDLVHVVNEGKRDPKTCARYKAEGMVPGYPDYILDVPRRGYHGLRCEAKRPGEKPTKAQRVELDRLSQRGYYCFDWDDVAYAISQFKWYLDVKAAD